MSKASSSGALRRSAKFLDVSDERFVAENFPQRSLVHIQIQNGPVAVHHRRNRRIDDELRAQFRGQRLHARDNRAAFWTISTLAMVTCMPVRPQQAHRFDRLPERAGHLGNGVVHFGTCE